MQPKSHIFMYPFPAWGHNKTLYAFAVLITEARPDVICTIVTCQQMYTQLLAESLKLGAERKKIIEDRVHVIDVLGSVVNPLADPAQVVPSFEIMFRKSGSVTCLSSGRVYDYCADGIQPPCLAIIDNLALGVMKGIREISTKEQVPIFCWITGNAGFCLRNAAPEELGGIAGYTRKIEEVDEVVKKTGRSGADVAREIIGATEGKLVQIPGYPLLYDYELYPQNTMTMFPENTMIPIEFLSIETYNAMMFSEGTINISSNVLEKPACEALKGYFESIGKAVFNFAHFNVIKESMEWPETADARELHSFLDQMQEQHGDRSVIYISFGSLVWPDMDKFTAIIDELIATKTPFVFTHPRHKIPQDLLHRTRGCPTGLDIVWAPQLHVLQHPATGWFITHGGWNSVQESFIYKVPLIFLPIVNDQPLIAALISGTHKAAFELVEARSGDRGTKKPYQNEISARPTPKFTVESLKEEIKSLLGGLRSEEGVTIRRNCEKLSDELAKVWEDGGEARLSLENFLSRTMSPK